ncbi:MAG: DUF4160 domain-containing protein [Microscillaceae bacterium]|nr:DUF4160 domain-containing protein [Microscillaceae bacterium]
MHVESAENTAKFWLDEVDLANSYGFSARDINRLRKLVLENQEQFKQAWNEYFNEP